MPQIRIERAAYQTIDSDNLEFENIDGKVLTFDEWKALPDKEQKEWSWDFKNWPLTTDLVDSGVDETIFFSDDDKWTEFGRL